MGRYIPTGCCKCDFSEGQNTKLCKKDFCHDYEESYIFDKNCDNANLGYGSIEDFNRAFGTKYAN